MNFDRRKIIKILYKEAKISIIHVSLFSFFFNLILFSSPIYMLQIYNRILPARGEETLFWLTALIIILFIAMAAIDAARHMVFVRLAGQFEQRVSHHLLSLTLKKSARSHEPEKSNVLLEVDKIRNFLSKGHLLHFFDLMWFPLFVLAIGLFHPVLAFIALLGGITMALVALANHIFVGRSMETARDGAVRSLSQAEQMTRKADVVQSLGMKSSMMRRWNMLRHEAVTAHMAASDQFGIVSSISKALRMLIQSITLGTGAYLAIHDSISPGAIVAASILIGRALGPIEASILGWQELVKVRLAAIKLVSLLEQSESLPESVHLPGCIGCLEVENLSCSIGGHQILRDINFETTPGEMIAILGPSGCGKTTLVRHLIGSWSGTTGIVRLDDVDIAKLTDDARLRYVGYLPQEIDLLDGSIVETISRFGNPEAEDILETAKIAGIHRMILRLPQGYGTRTGVDGHRLSGGQRQRLALARAIYGRPTFVVLDEPCAHLDELGVRTLIEAIENLKRRGTTLCVVTHKTNFVRLADRVLIMNDKGEARFGRPPELYKPILRAVSGNEVRQARRS